MIRLPPTIIRGFILLTFSSAFTSRDSIMTTFMLLFSRNLPSMKIIVVRRGVSHLRLTFRRL